MWRRSTTMRHFFGASGVAPFFSTKNALVTYWSLVAASSAPTSKRRCTSVPSHARCSGVEPDSETPWLKGSGLQPFAQGRR